jgi:hypothetical protein
MGQKVIYVDGLGTRYDAEITGPVKSIRKHRYTKDGGGVLRVSQPGEVICQIGEQVIKGTTAEENRTKPYVNLTVNFGDENYPRYGDVTGVRLKDDRDRTYRKGYYEPLPQVEAAPIADDKAAKAAEKEAAKAAKAAEKK